MTESCYPSAPVLLVDDELQWLGSLAMALEYSGGINHVLQCSDSRQVMDLLSRQEVSVVLLDLTMPNLSGEDLLPLIVEEHPETPVLILSGMNQIETAVKCMRAGAFDYFVKTVEMDRLIVGVQRALEHQSLQRKYSELKSRFLKDSLDHPEVFSDTVTGNKKMRSVFQYVEAVAESSEPVLITGESGVGKEHIARAVQRLGRPEGPWVAVNVAGLDDNVFADTLFGHLQGAFTGADRDRPGMIEEASSGTLFLDEIGDLSLASQVKLLRLLQEGEYFPLGSDRPKRVNARFVFATNHDLLQKQETGTFRKDLYYRLKSHHVEIPPLRERQDDIPLLLNHFLRGAAEAMKTSPPTPPKELQKLLATYSFPGNVRELRAMVYDAVSLHRSGILPMDSFKKAIGRGSGSAENLSGRSEPGEGDPLFPLSDSLPTLAEAAEMLVAEAMERSGGNQSIAAGLLGISRQALNKRIKKTSS